MFEPEQLPMLGGSTAIQGEYLKGYADQRGPWIISASGHRVYPLDLKPAEVSLEDVVRALSRKCRFGGMCRVFWSVAEHSIFGATIARNLRLSPRVQLDFLLHDFAEAFLGDIPTPLKNETRFRVRGWDLSAKVVERQMLVAIYDALRVSPPSDADLEVVKYLDRTCFVREWRALMPGPVPVGFWDEYEYECSVPVHFDMEPAEQELISRFKETREIVTMRRSA